MQTSHSIQTNSSNQVSDILGRLIGNLETSKGYADAQILDSIGKSIHDFITNPLEGNIEMLLLARHGVMDLMERVILLKLNAQREIIDSVYQVDEPDRLHYIIILHENTLENECNFIEFLHEYQGLEIDKLVPIAFTCLGKEFKDKLLNVKPIPLESSSSSQASFS